MSATQAIEQETERAMRDEIETESTDFAAWRANPRTVEMIDSMKADYEKHSKLMNDGLCSDLQMQYLYRSVGVYEYLRPINTGKFMQSMLQVRLAKIRKKYATVNPVAKAKTLGDGYTL